MHWHDDYRRKCFSAQEAVRLINSGDRLFTSGNVATPRMLLRALVERQRARALIDIAHPQFREALERAAWERYLL